MRCSFNEHTRAEKLVGTGDSYKSGHTNPSPSWHRASGLLNQAAVLDRMQMGHHRTGATVCCGHGGERGLLYRGTRPRVWRKRVSKSPSTGRRVRALPAVLCPSEGRRPRTGAEGRVIRSEVDGRLINTGTNQGDEAKTHIQQDEVL